MTAQERIEAVGKSFNVPDGMKLDIVKTPAIGAAPLCHHYTFVSDDVGEFLPLASIEVSFRRTDLDMVKTDILVLTLKKTARPKTIAPYILASVAALDLANKFEAALKE